MNMINISRTETRTYKASRRENGKCKRCKAHHTRLVTLEIAETYRTDIIAKPDRRIRESVDGGPVRAVECCGAHVLMQAVQGTRNPEIECGAKCRSSKGHVCECSCGGKNHGAGH